MLLAFTLSVCARADRERDRTVSTISVSLPLAIKTNAEGQRKISII